MLFATQTMHQPAALVARRGQKLSGYALNVYGIWSCIALITPHSCGMPNPRQISYTVEEALAWLRQSTNGNRFEPVADRDELDALIRTLPVDHEPIVLPDELIVATYANPSIFAPFN